MSRLGTKLTGFILAVHDTGSRGLVALHRSTGLTWGLSKPPARFGLELFVALALTVNFFYLVKPLCSPRQTGSLYPGFMFTCFSTHAGLSINDAPAQWQTRLLGPLLSGCLLDVTTPPFVKISMTQIQPLFGLYHSAWLFLLFVSLIYLRKDALFLMLGVFAGLMYNLTGPAGNYYFPWDMPALFFFTLACLLFDKGWMKILIPVVVIGSLFKETILCCSLFILLGSHWTWPRHLAAFLATLLATFGLNHLLMAHYGVHASTFAMNGATSLTDLVNHTLLYKNLHLLFSLNLNHVLFANAGALFLMMLVPWQSRRDVLFKLVILAFAAGQFLYGIIDEVRVWYELLPLGWIILSDALARPRPTPEESQTRTARLFQGTHWLCLAALVLLMVGAFAWVTPPSPVSKPPAATMEPIPSAMLDAAQAGDREAQYNVGVFLFNNRQDYAGAMEWFRKAVAQGHLNAQYNLGAIYWNGLTGKQDLEAIQLFRTAAQQGSFEAQMALGKIFQEGQGVPPDFVEAYRWLKLAARQKGQATSSELEVCAARMSPDQIAAAEQQVKDMPGAPNNAITAPPQDLLIAPP